MDHQIKTIGAEVKFSWRSKRRVWNLKVWSLAVYGGITTHLNEGLDWHEDFLLDWHDIFNNPYVARMHMFLGAKRGREVPYETKLRRMESWIAAIEAYDSIMSDDYRAPLTKNEVEEMFAGRVLPRPKTVIFDTGTSGLIKLLKALGFTQDSAPPYPFLIPWKKFVEVAVSGKLLEVWKYLKQRA
ncbi:MAG: hypothetical protein HYW70_01425 [Candidatus Nealsonbacteria bacterium]|nr:hypothetical protein [Candidatus Nealsonbacteria bacterium]